MRIHITLYDFLPGGRKWPCFSNTRGQISRRLEEEENTNNENTGMASFGPHANTDRKEKWID